jgi:purine-binding chemotaxis protein CheW
MNNEREQFDDAFLVATFLLGNAAFGISAAHVQEVVRVGDITPVHHAPASVVGIRNLRGRIVTVTDLCSRLELGIVSISPQNRILIVDWQGEPVGLLVDSIADTISVNQADIVPSPPNVNRCQAKYVLGVCRSGERLVALLDPSAVLQPEDQSNSMAAREQVTS